MVQNKTDNDSSVVQVRPQDLIKHFKIDALYGAECMLNVYRLLRHILGIYDIPGFSDLCCLSDGELLKLPTEKLLVRLESVTYPELSKVNKSNVKLSGYLRDRFWEISRKRTLDELADLDSKQKKRTKMLPSQLVRDTVNFMLYGWSKPIHICHSKDFMDLPCYIDHSKLLAAVCNEHHWVSCVFAPALHIHGKIDKLRDILEKSAC
jgi:hypothetical protein